MKSNESHLGPAFSRRENARIAQAGANSSLPGPSRPTDTRDESRHRYLGMHKANPLTFGPGLLLPLPDAPRLDELMVDVNRVVDVQDQPLAPIQKPQTKKIVIDKSCRRIGDGIPEKFRPGLAGV